VSRLGRARDRLAASALGVDLPGLLLGTQQSLTRIEERVNQLEDDLTFVKRRLSAHAEGLRGDRDGTTSAVEQLAELRRTLIYEEAIAETEPLVSVRIASYLNTEELIDVAIASVRAQSYEHFEVIVVNDGPNPETRAALSRLGDSRIRYEEFDERKLYPQDPHARWMVAGSPGMNRGADLATGTWIAPLDEDDSFTPDHLEKLVMLATGERAELAYGALLQRNLVNKTEALIWSSPPLINQFSFQGSLYLSLLTQIFHYDEQSWIVEEPGDWNLIRRMSTAGVRMATTRDVVAVMNQIPYTHKVDR
jgi:hypothetical protein